MARRALLCAVCGIAPMLSGQPAGGIGRVRFVLEETRAGHGGSPGMRFVFSTAEVHGCQSLVADLRLAHDTIYFGPFSAHPLPGPCPPTVTPAIGMRTVSLENGRYVLRVANGAANDPYAVDVSETLIITRPTRPPVGSIVSDSAAMRVQKNTFAFSCGALKDGQPFCTAAILAIEGVRGLTLMTVPKKVREWHPQMNGYWYNEPTRYFRYPDESAVASVQKVLRDLYRTRVGEQTGYALAISTWDGTDIYVAHNP